MNVSEKEFGCLVERIRGFVKSSDQASKCLKILLKKNKTEIESTEPKSILFTHYCKVTNEHWNRKIPLLFHYENNKSYILSAERFEQYGNQFILT